MEIVLLGHMGRDEAAADRLYPGNGLHVIGQWENPGLAEKAAASGGSYHRIDNIKNAEGVADIVQAIEPDMFITNFDDALAAGTVDAIRRRVDDKRMPRVLMPCPDRRASRVEWDKFYLRQIVDEIDPNFNPLNYMCVTSQDVLRACAVFDQMDEEIAVKPRDLTGGKGVWVQGKHFDTRVQGRDYALSVLQMPNQTGVEIQQKLIGREFTLQIFTDGREMIAPPLTYDFPYREDGDVGPGTGGMGAFSKADGSLPFVSDEDYAKAMTLMGQLLDYLGAEGIEYKGVLYPTFFKTVDGLKIVEVNARGGDPELINILDLLEDDVDYASVLTQIAEGNLAPDAVRYKKLASTMVYLVSPEYGYEKGPSYEFGLDPKRASEHDVKIRFAAAERIAASRYKTAGSSRIVGLSALGNTPWEARQRIDAAIAGVFERPLALQHRRDIGSRQYIDALTLAA
jgi:phosphoribosylamine--glycine ligase